jgi:hypothetical protein
MAKRPELLSLEIFPLPDSRLEEARVIRRARFAEYPVEADFNGDQTSMHVIARSSTGIAVGAARYQSVREGVVELQRVAVLTPRRGIGTRMLELLLAELKKQEVHEVRLETPINVAPFYASDALKFKQEGRPFRRENSPPLIQMRRRLQGRSR